MKVPKRMVRNADGTKKPPGEGLERPYRIAIVGGKAERVYATSNGYALPAANARWATEDDAHHAEVADAMAVRASNASKR